MGNLSEWRAQRRTTTSLPSGLVVTLRRVTVEDLAARGAIPTPLVAQVQALQARQQGGDAPDLAALPDISALIDVVVEAALVEPAIADVADETHITLDELPLGDRLHIFGWAQGVAAGLATFPGNPAGAGAGDSRAGDDLRADASRVDAVALA